MILFIHACARPQSRTLALAGLVSEKLAERPVVRDLFEESLPPLDHRSLSKRESAIEKADYSDPVFRFAKEFCEADEIVIATPYWDLSFPAVLKCYLEAICVNGLTFRYNEAGIPEGLCRAKRLFYVTTAGGWIPENNFGYGYVKQLCNDFFGIRDTVLIKAEGLDVAGADTSAILEAAKHEINARL